MSTQSEIAINATKAKEAKYDAEAKELFQHPEIIAPVLKGVIPEYKEYSVEEVISYINQDSIKDDAIDDVSVIANPLPTEMSSVSDKLIRYDAHL